LRWFHQIDFGFGLITPGLADLGFLKAFADVYFAGGINGQTVPDIGCWDGFNSAEAVRRDAPRVLATDHWVWGHHPWAERATIELVREHVAPQIDLPDLVPERAGVFDVVLFCGVLYRLPKIMAGLEKAAALVLSALAPASMAGRMKVEIFQAACNTLRTVAVRRRKWNLR
jgi:tRNA (mo5U34)-methyltransferase